MDCTGNLTVFEKRSTRGRRSREGRVLSLAVALLASSAMLPSTWFPGAAALAQGYFSDSYGYYGYGTAKARAAKRARPANAQSVKAPRGSEKKTTATAKAPVEPEVKPQGPLVIAVSIGRQRLAVYDDTRVIAESAISSGRIGYSTPTGVFSIVEKNRVHHSNLYGGAPMPNMQRITWSGVALHAGDLPGYPASHGCIRLPHGFSKKLFGMTKLGTRVIVSRDLLVPKTFAHDRLFKAYPPENELVTAAAAQPTLAVADATRLAAAGVTDAVTQVIGVTSARASETAPEAAPAKPTYRERRKLEAEALAGTIRDAGYRKAEATILLQAANSAAQDKREPYNRARIEIARLNGEARKAVAAKERALKDLADLEALIERKGDNADLAAKRTSLQDAAAALSDAADVADDTWKLAIEASKATEAAWQAAEDKRREALKTYSLVSTELDTALEREQTLKRLEAKRALPVSVFISRKTQKIYARQGYQPILEAAVTIDRPDDAIGTHVMTALDFAPGMTALEWSVVTAPSGGKSAKDDKKRKGADEATASAPPSSPAEALERITIPEDVREQIEDLMKPGSSLIISDNGMSGETGEYTDFIVSTR